MGVKKGTFDRIARIARREEKKIEEKKRRKTGETKRKFKYIKDGKDDV